MVGGDSTTRRGAIRAGVATALGALAGCTSVVGERGSAVSILAAGSLNNALENGLRPAVDAALQTEVHGSAECARLVDSGQKDPDILSLADPVLFDSLADTEWVAEFATNSLVLAYNPETTGGQRVADAEAWYEPLLDGAVSLGRTDPRLDPLGYRALFMLELATAYYDTDRNLRDAVPRREQMYPETQLVSQFETGAIDAAIAYRSMATERGYEMVDLPPEIALSDPAFAERYRQVEYELPDGTVVTGAPISYGSTVRHRTESVTEVFETHVTGSYLTDFGFAVPDDYPRYTGNVPVTVTN